MNNSPRHSCTDETVKIQITIELTRAEAWHFAQFLKRASFSTFERLSDPSIKDEPQLMCDAAITVQRALRDAGFAPR